MWDVWTRRRAQPFLMRAWDAFRARHPRSPLRLVVVGGGDMSAAVARWATQHPSVTMAGHVSRPEVFRILANPVPWSSRRSGRRPSAWLRSRPWPLGRPPVASAHGAFPELITPRSDGALFPPTDVDALVDILADIDDNPQRWDEYGQLGRADLPKPLQPGRGYRPAARDLPLRGGASTRALWPIASTAPRGPVALPSGVPT